MFLAHGPVSFLANEVVQKKKIKKLNNSEHILIALASFFFGILPDFDLFVASKLNIPGFVHHTFISHTPIFYISIWILLKILVNPIHGLLNKKTGKTLNKNFLNILIDTFLIATLFHLLADFVVARIMLFYPLTDFRFTMLFWILEPNLFTSYFISSTFAIELIFISIFTFVVYRIFFKTNVVCNILTKGFVLLTFLILPLSIYISSNTYNRSYMYDSEGYINYDIDYDTLKDSLDMDVGNTGKDNIQEAKSEDIFESAYDIVNSGKWAGQKGSEDLLSSLRYIVGAHDSLRIVSQAYYNNHLPIGPVLRDFAIKRDGFISYSYEYGYTELLFDYLEENGMLNELDWNSEFELEPGKIFFLKDRDGEILNLGITLEGNYLATVLKDDIYLQKHSLDDVRDNYENSLREVYVEI